MAIVTLRELMARMGDPDWGPEVRRDGERLISTLTATLAGRLGTYIEPGPERTERAAVSERGMVVTDHPVYEVIRIDGAPGVLLAHPAAPAPEPDPDPYGDPYDTADDDGADDVEPIRVPPYGWRVQDHRVFRDQIGGALSGTFPPPSVYASPVVDTAGLAGMLGMSALSVGVAGPVVPHVTIVYRPGWGDHEALRGAIISKATALMIDRHDDTITARALEGQTPPKPMSEDWSADEIAALGSFRSIAGPEWTRF